MPFDRRQVGRQHVIRRLNRLTLKARFFGHVQLLLAKARVSQFALDPVDHRIHLLDAQVGIRGHGHTKSVKRSRQFLLGLGLFRVRADLLVNRGLAHATAFCLDHLHQPIYTAVVVGVVNVFLRQKSHFQGAFGQGIEIQTILAERHRQDLVCTNGVRFAHHIPGNIGANANRSQKVTERACLFGRLRRRRHAQPLADFRFQFFIADAGKIIRHHSYGPDDLRVGVGWQLNTASGRNEIGDPVGFEKVADGRRISTDKPRATLALAECDGRLIDRLVGRRTGLHRPGCRAGCVPGKAVLSIGCWFNAPIELTLQALALAKPALRVLGRQVSVTPATVPDLGRLYSGRRFATGLWNRATCWNAGISGSGIDTSWSSRIRLNTSCSAHAWARLIWLACRGSSSHDSSRASWADILILQCSDGVNCRGEVCSCGDVGSGRHRRIDHIERSSSDIIHRLGFADVGDFFGDGFWGLHGKASARRASSAEQSAGCFGCGRVQNALGILRCGETLLLAKADLGSNLDGFLSTTSSKFLCRAFADIFRGAFECQAPNFLP